MAEPVQQNKPVVVFKLLCCVSFLVQVGGLNLYGFQAGLLPSLLQFITLQQ